jgi:hypothetical protein
MDPKIMNQLEFIPLSILGIYLMASFLLAGLFAFGGLAVTGTDISAARTRGALTHPITTGLFLWSVYSTLDRWAFGIPLPAPPSSVAESFSP